MQVRDLDESVQERLKAAAAARGQSLSEFLRVELARLADQLEERKGIRQRLFPGLGPIRPRGDFDFQAFLDEMHAERDARWG